MCYAYASMGHFSWRAYDMLFCHSRLTVHVILPSLLRWNRSTSKTTNCQGNVTTFVITAAPSVFHVTDSLVSPLMELCLIV